MWKQLKMPASVCPLVLQALAFLENEFSGVTLKFCCVLSQEFDKKYNPTWHCIVGRNFGSYVTHETKHFIYFYLGQVAILLFKSG
ncbi:Dynein light chain 1, cytoplasmic [Cricetulus griseus]|uniref:Dynein light chain n=1 Tax=Cricetulus griseus TaxID=10029 RepID=G3HI52_CRIGR|nr:Dynein light chain 1, cytoplasmic [Cricetulus griseus]ERE75900.1 dynein light chain 1, cytoplasmic-like protein [Cricetulus griseus]